MIFFEPYKKARINIESRFKGLQHAHTTLIKSLITLANPQTGIVTNITYSDLSELLTVNKAPGRTESGIPQKQAIRSYLRSIEKQCPEDFKVISEGQKLQFQFPLLPAIYEKFMGNHEVYTGVNTNQYTATPIENTEENDELTPIENTQEYTEVYTDQYTPCSAVKKLFINNKTNNNNNTQGMAIGSKSTAKTISQDFYPTQETIARAIAAGHHNATDANIIQDFIDKNTAWGSTFADFNPIFLSFLAKHAERKKLKESVPSSTQTRSRGHERTPPQINSYDTALEAVRIHNQNACKPSDEELFPSHKIIGIERSARIMALDGANKNLRPALSY